MQSKH